MAIPDVSTDSIYEGELPNVDSMSEVTHVRVVTATESGSEKVPIDEFTLPASQINNGSSVTGATVDDALTQLNTAKAADNSVVHSTGNETVAGVKTFSSSPIVPNPTTDLQADNKGSRTLADSQFYAKAIEPIAPNATAPSPVIPTGTTKTYEFSSGGVCAWLANQVVEKGDKVTVAFTAPSTFTRTYQDVVSRKVDKVVGKSLILDTEIARLSSVTNQTLGGLGGEAVANKETTLTNSDTKFGASSAVLKEFSKVLEYKEELAEYSQGSYSEYGTAIASPSRIRASINIEDYQHISISVITGFVVRIVLGIGYDESVTSLVYGGTVTSYSFAQSIDKIYKSIKIVIAKSNLTDTIAPGDVSPAIIGAICSPIMLDRISKIEDKTVSTDCSNELTVNNVNIQTSTGTTNSSVNLDATNFIYCHGGTSIDVMMQKYTGNVSDVGLVFYGIDRSTIIKTVPSFSNQNSNGGILINISIPPEAYYFRHCYWNYKNIKTYGHPDYFCRVNGIKFNPRIAGKRISILGDSISTFGVPDQNNATGEFTYPLNRCRYPQGNLFTDVNHTYWMRLININKLILGINESWAGSRISWDGITESTDIGVNKHIASATRIGHLGNNGTPDIIFIYAGTNDIGSLVDIGTFNTESPINYTAEEIAALPVDTFYNAVRTLIIRVMKAYPLSQIIYLFPGFTTSYGTLIKTDEYNEAARVVCDYFGVLYLDDRQVGINPMSLSSDLPDGVHPGISGMEKIYRYIRNELNTLIR
jgi:lysophospholipase L1-like esterase